jgi:signal transduction histidine kinase
MAGRRFLFPVILVSLCLVVLCAFTAISLVRQQAGLAEVLKRTVARRRAGTELEECIRDLLVLLRDRVESVSALHQRVETHLATIRGFADKEEDRELSRRLDQAFASYMERWRALPPLDNPEHEHALRELARFLETDLLRPCQEYEAYNDRNIEASTRQHDQVLRQLGWGMVVVSGLGGVAGLVLGFGFARALRTSIRRLEVQIRDAAGKLGQGIPEVIVTEEGDFRGLQEQMNQLMHRIEAVLQELQQRELEVLRAEQLAAVGQLAAGMAHEIRNPLTSVKMLVQTGLEDGGGGRLGSEDLQIIEAEIRRVERSLQTFLDFARPPRTERRPVDLRDVVQSVLGLVRGRLEKQRVKVDLQLPLDRVVLTADGTQLQQVLVNLTLNALDAMPEGGTLSLTMRPARSGVLVEVADTGSGIAPQVRGRLFQPFVSNKETGLGLGLVISRRIVEDHGGQLVAADRPGGGAVFKIFLPIPAKMEVGVDHACAVGNR